MKRTDARSRNVRNVAWYTGQSDQHEWMYAFMLPISALVFFGYLALTYLTN